MRYNIFDIETCPQDKEKLASIMPEFKPEEVALGNRKDPAKIEAYLKEAQLKHEEAFYQKAALSATTGRVLIVGVMNESGEPEFLEGKEEDIVYEFWGLWSIRSSVSFIGFNCKAFDIPFLVRRSWALGVRVPVDVCGKRQSERIIDVFERWMVGVPKSENGTSDLNMVSKTLGFAGKNGKGKDFANLYISDRKKALDYAANDLALTRGVALKMGVIQ